MNDLESVDISLLVLDPSNARKHSEKNLEAIKGSLKKFGQQKPIIVDGNNIVVAGNGTLSAAKALGWKKIGVIRTSLTGADATAFAIADNRTAELAEWDLEPLQKTLNSLMDMDFDLGSIGFDQDFMEAHTPTVENPGLTDPDEVPENVETRCKPGDLWMLGEHRLLCGDSTNVQHVERLMGGEKADMVFTDPPYGVSYTKKTKEVFNSDLYTEIKNDEKSGEDLKDFFRSVFAVLRTVMTESCSYYVCSPQGGDSEMMMMMMRENDMKCRHQIIWVKDAPVFSMGRLDYDYKHEPILYGWTKRHEFKRKGSQDKSVWEFKRTENKLHPTMKPVELIENAILNSSDHGALTVDFFLGSGSTLIACEKTNRKCYGMEIDPHYCDVIIERWEKFTGKKASLLSGEISGNA